MLTAFTQRDTTQVHISTVNLIRHVAEPVWCAASTIQHDATQHNTTQHPSNRPPPAAHLSPRRQTLFMQPKYHEKLRSLSLERDVLPGLPAEIESDATRLVQVVTNLLSNAVKFTRAGGRVRLTVAPVWPPGTPEEAAAQAGEGLAGAERCVRRGSVGSTKGGWVLRQSSVPGGAAPRVSYAERGAWDDEQEEAGGEDGGGDEEEQQRPPRRPHAAASLPHSIAGRSSVESSVSLRGSSSAARCRIDTSLDGLAPAPPPGSPSPATTATTATTATSAAALSAPPHAAPPSRGASAVSAGALPLPSPPPRPPPRRASRPLVRFVRFTVEDDGIGIAPENLEKIFEAFTQVDQASNREYQARLLCCYLRCCCAPASS